MSKARLIQQNQDDNYEYKYWLNYFLLEIVKSNPKKTYKFYRIQLLNLGFIEFSKRTLQRNISICKKLIQQKTDPSINDIIIDRKQILSRDEIILVKQHLEEQNLLNLTKKQLIDFINQNFIIDHSKFISYTSKFVYGNFDGYFFNQNMPLKENSYKENSQKDYQQKKNSQKENSLKENSQKENSIQPPDYWSYIYKELENSKNPFNEQNQQEPLSSCYIDDIYEQQNNQNNARILDYTKQNQFAQQFEESDFNFGHYSKNVLQEQNDQKDIINKDTQDIPELTFPDFNFSN